MNDSLERWSILDMIDFHDMNDVNEPTRYKMSDVKGYTLGTPRLETIAGETWIVVPAEIINRDLAYQIYIKEKRGKPVEISAEYGWKKLWLNGKVQQVDINPHLISLVPNGHMLGNKIVLAS